MIKSVVGGMRRVGWGTALPLLLTLAAIGLVVVAVPFRFVFEFDTDEGLELMKALLLARGYQLYGEILHDHPPVLTAILAWAIGIFGPSVTLARLTILGFSALLLSAAAAYLQLAWGKVHAVLGLLLLLSLPFYLQLSVSVMPGLPAISLAMLSVLLLEMWHRSHRPAYVVASGLALALSAMTKLFTGVLVPVLGVGILVSAWRNRRPDQGLFQTLQPAWLWGGAVALPILGILISGGAEDVYGQLVTVHLLARRVSELGGETGNLSYAFHRADHWPLYTMAAWGAYLAVRLRRWTTLHFLGWGVLGAAFLVITAPVWYHHQLLVTVPAAVLAAVAVGQALIGLRCWPDTARGRLRSFAAAFVAVVFLIGSFVAMSPRLTEYVSLDLPNFRGPVGSEISEDYVALSILNKSTEPGERIIADRPIFAFRAGLEVPPDLAWVSEKRMMIGQLTENDFLRAIESQRPKAVLLGRFKLATVEAALGASYNRVYSKWPVRLYIRADPSD